MDKTKIKLYRKSFSSLLSLPFCSPLRVQFLLYLFRNIFMYVSIYILLKFAEMFYSTCNSDPCWNKHSCYIHIGNWVKTVMLVSHFDLYLSHFEQGSVSLYIYLLSIYTYVVRHCLFPTRLFVFLPRYVLCICGNQLFVILKITFSPFSHLLFNYLVVLVLQKILISQVINLQSLKLAVFFFMILILCPY